MHTVLRFRPFGLLAFIVAACLLLSGCGLFGQNNQAPSAVNGSVAVKPGTDTVLGSSNGSPEVTIPAASATGQGTLSVSPADGPDGRKGWHVSLNGAQLTGTATIRFKNAVSSGEPAPLIGFNENPGDPVSYDVQSQVDGSDIVVTTSHFSNWFTDSWEWLMNWAKDEAKKVFTATAGEDPKCDKESEARANGLTVSSDSGDRVKWCLGKASDGNTVLKVNNSRSYGVSLERTPGLTITRRGDNIGDAFPKLVGKITTTPSKRGNTVDILGPGETVEYNVDSSAGNLGVKIDPSPPAYLATALWFGVQTIAMAWTKFGKIDTGHIADVMDAVDCTSGFQSMSTAQITSGAAAADYLATAIKAVMPCTGKVFERLAKGVLLDVVAVAIAQVFSWLAGGIETAVDGIKATIDSIAFNGYQVIIQAPAAAPPAPAAPAIPGLPPELSGKWCTRGGPSTCFSAAEIKQKYPDARVMSQSPTDGQNGFYRDTLTGATDYTICVQMDLGEHCSMASTMSLRYFPAGVGWNCVKAEVVGGAHWPGCQPDYTSLHDPSQPRLLEIPNHQQNDSYVDSPPMYRVG